MLKIFFVFLCLFSFGCSNGGGGGGKAPAPYKKLDKKKKDRLARLTKSVGDTQAVVDSYIPEKKSQHAQNKVGPHGLMNMALMASINNGDSPSLGQNKVMTKEALNMKKMIDENDCKMNLPVELGELGGGNLPSVPEFTVTINGAACPVKIAMSIKADKQSEDGFTATMKYSFEAISPEYKALSDVDKVHITGKFSGGFVEVQDGLKISLDVDFSGSGHSQLEGNFDIGFLASTEMIMPKGENMVVGPKSSKDDFEFPGFDLKIAGSFNSAHMLTFGKVRTILEEKTKINGFTDMKQEYFLNKAKITAEEYHELLGNMQYIGTGSELPGQSVGPIDSSTNQDANFCQVSVYDSNEVSLNDIYESIYDKKQILFAPLVGFDSCHDLSGYNIKGDVLVANWTKDPNMLQLEMFYESKQRQLPLQFYAGAFQPLDTVQQYEDLVVRLTCTPELSCH